MRLSRSGFTVIELLVVIAIMGVLAATLLSVSQSAQASVRATKCVSNLRQLGVAIRLYGNDNENYIPPSQPSVFAEVRQDLWPQWIWPYVYPERPYVGYAGKAPPAVFSNTVFECPQMRLEKNVVNYRSYACNWFIGDNNVLTGDKFTAVPNPSTAVILADQYNYSQMFPNSLAPRHSGKCNALYLDGHVGAIGITSSIRKGTIAQPIDPFWGVQAQQ